MPLDSALPDDGDRPDAVPVVCPFCSGDHHGFAHDHFAGALADGSGLAAAGWLPPSVDLSEIAATATAGGPGPTGTNYIDSLLWGVKWTGNPITWSLQTEYDEPGFVYNGVKAWNSTESAAVSTALAAFSSVANVSFQNVGVENDSANLKFHLFNGADMAFLFGSSNVIGAFFPPDPGYGWLTGYGYFNYEAGGWHSAGLQKGGFGFSLLLHEIGHGLGLAHPHDTGGGSSVLPSALDTGLYTVMSYNDLGEWWNPYGGYSTSSSWGTYGQAASLMPFDIATLQHIYGANTGYRTGNDTYSLLTSRYETIWDAGGVDTITAAGLTGNVTIDLNEGTTLSSRAGSYGGYLIAYGAAIENATGGSGDDTLVGNALANVLDGGAGSDTLRGGRGDDTYLVDSAADAVIENAGEGTDTVVASVSWTLGANVENLTLSGSAGIDATGNVLDNVLTGNAGDNVLDGGAGADTMIGGRGGDVYFVDNAGDVVIETDPGSSATAAHASGSYTEVPLLWASAGGGLYSPPQGSSASPGTVMSGAEVDEVRASVDYALPGHVENLTLLGSGNIGGTGNALDNLLTGNDGNNVLDGGAGADTLIGGLGDDTYRVDSAGDVVTENAGEGTDTVVSSVSWTLGDNVENLTLSGSADLGATGNALDNVLTGNDGDNVLAGGDGDDTLIGGAGADVAAFGASSSNYEIRVSASAGISVVDTDATDGESGTDALAGIETARFANGDVAIVDVPAVTAGVFDPLRTVDVGTFHEVSHHRVVALPNGNDVYIWAARTTPHLASADVFYRVVDPAGNVLVADTSVTDVAAGYQIGYAVAVLADGGFVVAGLSDQIDGDGHGIFARRFDADGTPVGADIRVNTLADANQGGADVAATPDGGFAVVWKSFAAGATGIQGQIFDAAGARVGPELEIVRYDAADVPRIAALDDGRLLVTHERNDGSWDGVFGQIFTAGGQPAGAEFRVNTSVPGDQESIPPVALAGGGFVAGWDAGYPATEGVTLRVFDAGGSQTGADIVVDATAGSRAAKLFAMPDGGFFVGWTRGGANDAYYARYAADGSPVGEAVSLSGGVAAAISDFARSADGVVTATWYAWAEKSVLNVVAISEVSAPAATAITGTADADTITGLDGTQVIDGAGGDDVLAGGDGDDILTGGAGDDSLDGGAGIDTAVFAGDLAAYVFADLGGGAYEVAGADGTDVIVDVEFLQFDDQTVSADALPLAPPPNTAPVATAADRSIVQGTTVALSSLVAVSDADGDAITQYRVHDGTGGPSGVVTAGGSALAAGTDHVLSAAEFAAATFTAGPAGVADRITVEAFDGTDWSAPATALLTAYANTAPTVVVADMGARERTTYSMASLVSVADPDGDPVQAFRFWDSTPWESGYFRINGAMQPAIRELNVSAADFAAMTFTTGRAGTYSDQIWVQAFDGYAWNAWQTFFVTPMANSAPVVSAANIGLRASTTFDASSLFTVSDTDGDAIEAYRFWDSTPWNSGYFRVNGEVQAAARELNVTAAEFATMTFTTGEIGSPVDQVWVQAFDGLHWSAWQTFFVSPGPNQRPVTTASDGTLAPGETVLASSLFSVTDPDGDPILQYRLWDSTPWDTGWFTVGGTVQAASREFSVTAAEFDTMTFTAGPDGATDQVWVQAYDGVAWSQWVTFFVTADSGSAGGVGRGGYVFGGFDATGTDRNDVFEDVRGSTTAGDGNDFVATLQHGSADGGAGNDILVGSSGNEAFTGGAGFDFIDGQTSVSPGDSAIFSGNYADYSIWRVDGVYIVAGGPGDTDVIVRTENFVFADQSVGVGSLALGDLATLDTSALVPGDIFITGYLVTGATQTFTGTEDGDIIVAGFGDEGYGNGGADMLVAISGGVTVLDGGAGADLLKAYSGGAIFPSLLRGGDGDDVLVGDNGRDELEGGAGHDFISGADYGDIIDGGTGNDYLVGGGGGDTFVFRADAGDDTIHDFALAEDVLLLEALTLAAATPLIETDTDGDGTLDTIVTFSDGGTVTLLGVSGITDPNDLFA